MAAKKTSSPPPPPQVNAVPDTMWSFDLDEYGASEAPVPSLDYSEGKLVNFLRRSVIDKYKPKTLNGQNATGVILEVITDPNKMDIGVYHNLVRPSLGEGEGLYAVYKVWVNITSQVQAPPILVIGGSKDPKINRIESAFLSLLPCSRGPQKPMLRVGDIVKCTPRNNDYLVWDIEEKIPDSTNLEGTYFAPGIASSNFKTFISKPEDPNTKDCSKILDKNYYMLPLDIDFLSNKKILNKKDLNNDSLFLISIISNTLENLELNTIIRAVPILLILKANTSNFDTLGDKQLIEENKFTKRGFLMSEGKEQYEDLKKLTGNDFIVKPQTLAEIDVARYVLEIKLEQIENLKTDLDKQDYDSLFKVFNIIDNSKKESLKEIINNIIKEITVC